MVQIQRQFSVYYFTPEVYMSISSLGGESNLQQSAVAMACRVRIKWLQLEKMFMAFF